MITSRKMLRGADGAQVEAQAKINLRLKILAREASGFHELETLFLRLSLADTVRLRRTSGTRSLDVAGLAEPGTIGPVEENLAWRAADLYCRATGLTGGFAIELEKRIPIGGGLGGGSADAGAVLRILDELSPTPLGDHALERLAAGLGTDVPFLTSPYVFALGVGRGDKFLGMTAPDPRAVMLLVPSFGVNTAQAYGWLAESRAADAHRAPVPRIGLQSLHDWEVLAALAENDLEPVVAAHHPQIAALVAGLRQFGCAPAMMSGSGSVVFGILPDKGEPHGMFFGDSVRGLATFTATEVEPVLPLD
jgi:4-diphosphocytidyl-2-C-methyl-D-erythritol kinase